jgi:hypothetical protein
MAYHLDADYVSLNDLQERIKKTDLVPSRASLLDGIEMKFEALEQNGIKTLANLRNELRSPKHLETVSNVTGVDKQYLILLRREIEGYFPKPFRLKDFDWLPEGIVSKLEANGIHDTAALYNTTSSIEGRAEFAKSIDVDTESLETLIKLADLTRVQWVSPTAARMLVEAAYDSASQVATADAEDLCQALTTINEDGRFFKGKIGLRDIKRLILAASYAPN